MSWLLQGRASCRNTSAGGEGGSAENGLEKLDACELLFIGLTSRLHDRRTTQETFEEHTIGADDDVCREFFPRIESERRSIPVGLDCFDSRSAERRTPLLRGFGEDSSEVSVLDEAQNEGEQNEKAWRRLTHVNEEEIASCLLEDSFFPLMRTDHRAGVICASMNYGFECRQNLTEGLQDANSVP